MRTRDFCTTPSDILGMCLHIVTTALMHRNWTNVFNYASKADGVPDLAVSFASPPGHSPPGKTSLA